MSDDASISVKIATDEHGLAECRCGSNDLYWRPVNQFHEAEADHTLEEAREIGGVLTWKERQPKEWDEDVGGKSFEEHIEDERRKAKQNGVTAYCGQCYGTMSPTVATRELVDETQ